MFWIREIHFSARTAGSEESLKRGPVRNGSRWRVPSVGGDPGESKSIRLGEIDPVSEELLGRDRFVEPLEGDCLGRSSMEPSRGWSSLRRNAVLVWNQDPGA